MRKALVKIHNLKAGIFTEESQHHYVFQYIEEYTGPPISLTMPVRNEAYKFENFPAFFEGVLPEGTQLEGLLKKHKIDKKDYFRQLLVTGLDLVGAVTIENLDE
jgi:serine/threonine-protein kinase HipA